MLKNFIKSIKRLGYDETSFHIKNVEYIIYLKAPLHHKLYSNLKNKLDENRTLVICDDQFGFNSKNYSYKHKFRVKVRFSLKEIKYLFTNHSYFTIKFFNNILKQSELKNIKFINFEDNYDLPTKTIINTYSFKNSYTIQHGILTDIEGYFPFSANIFIAKNINDVKIGTKYLNSNQKIFLGGDLSRSHNIQKTEFLHSLNKSLLEINSNNLNILVATDNFNKNLLDLIKTAVKQKCFSEIIVKPHPSSKFLWIIKLSSFIYSKIYSKKIIIEANINLETLIEKYEINCLLTNHSTLIYELLAKGVLPLTKKDIKNHKSPYYIKFPLIKLNGVSDFLVSLKYYNDKEEDLFSLYEEITSNNISSPQSKIVEIIENT